MKNWQKEALQHTLIIIAFAIFSIIYFYPQLSGKVLPQMDYITAEGVSHETKIYHEQEHRDIPWTNALFGGMPTYHMGHSISKPSIFRYILFFLNHTFLKYGTTSGLFLYMLGFYILLLTFKINKWISSIGAAAFGLSSYNIIIIAAGHITKVYAIAFMPVVLAGFIMIYKRKYWLGSLTALLGLGLQMTTSHLQIVYYTALTVGIYAIFVFFWRLKENKIKDFGIATGIALIITILVVLPNIMTLWMNMEAAKYSIRGKGELSSQNDKGNGLDKEYALAWSYGIGETFSLLIPNIKGGASAPLGNYPVAMNKVSPQYKDIISQQGAYFGNQPFTSGPVYFGAIIMFLAVLGMFVVKDRIKWFLFTATIVSIILSWGKNFGFVTDFLFNYLPLYNKFRTVSMALVIGSVTVPLLAMLAVNEIIENPQNLKANMDYLWIALGLTAGIALLFWLIPGFFNFYSKQEQSYFQELLKQSPQQNAQIQAVITQLGDARKALFRSDAIRSFAYILLSAGVLLFYLLSKKKDKNMTIALLGILIILDMFVIDRRYISGKDFIPKSQAQATFRPTGADQIILKDKDPYFRVLNIAVNTFNDATTSYYHKSIGGYHAAKLHIYQDVIEHYLSPYVQALQHGLQDSTFNLQAFIQSMPLLNALNTKYIIYNPNVFPIVNQYAYGNAWFVDNYLTVNSADEEIKKIGETNLQRTAVLNKQHVDVSKLPDIQMAGTDTLRNIKLTVYKPDILTFEVNSQKGGFIVFSDIYYPKGWIATIDDKPTEIYRVDYILRGLAVPPGQHIIKFSFRPKCVYLGKKLTLAGSIIVGLVLLFLLFKIYQELKQKKAQKDE